MKTRDKIDIYVDVRGKYRWRKRACNGRSVSESGQGYSAPSKVIDGLISAYRGHQVKKRDDGYFLSAEIADGVRPGTRSPKLVSVNIPLVLHEKVENYLNRKLS